MHTLQFGIRQKGQTYEVTLECTCGKIFSTAQSDQCDYRLFDAARRDGDAEAWSHLDQWRKCLGAG